MKSEPIVFVVMPFSKESDDLWEIGILETVHSLGWQCFRADRLADPGFIVNQVYESIEKADIIVAIMTGKNPNVFYEVGYAHCLGKPAVLLAESKADLSAFDVQGFRHFIYQGRIA